MTFKLYSLTVFVFEFQLLGAYMRENNELNYMKCGYADEQN